MPKSFVKRPTRRLGAIRQRQEIVIQDKKIKEKKKKRINKAKNATTKVNKVQSQDQPNGKKGKAGPQPKGKGTGSKGPIS